MLDKIVQRIGEKGYHFYSIGDQETPYEMIMRGPSEKVVPGMQYTLLPRVSQPRNPHHVMGATRDLVENGVDTYVDLRGRRVLLGQVVFYDDHVHVRGFEEPDTISSHHDFYEGLEALPPISDIKFPLYLP